MLEGGRAVNARPPGAREGARLACIWTHYATIEPEPLAESYMRPSYIPTLPVGPTAIAL